MLGLCGLFFLYGALRLYGWHMDFMEDLDCAYYDRQIAKFEQRNKMPLHIDDVVEEPEWAKHRVVDTREYTPEEKFWWPSERPE